MIADGDSPGYNPTEGENSVMIKINLVGSRSKVADFFA